MRTCSFASPRSSRPTRRRRQARLRRWCSIRIAASCWRAPAIRGPTSRRRRRGERRRERDADSLLDRARYGLYPPGSTFKLVTASAALRQHLDPRRTTFTCARLPDGRVGARINGWNRPVRDDVMDAHPHGTIDMHGGFVHSCNAYFAQLAVKLGSQPLLDTAARLGISLTPAADAVGARAPDAAADRLRPGRCRRDAVEDGARCGRRRVEWRAARHALRAGRSGGLPPPGGS